MKEEVRFLRKVLSDSGEVMRSRLREGKQLEVHVQNEIGKAFNDTETEIRCRLRKSSVDER